MLRGTLSPPRRISACSPAPGPHSCALRRCWESLQALSWPPEAILPRCPSDRKQSLALSALPESPCLLSQSPCIPPPLSPIPPAGAALRPSRIRLRVCPRPPAALHSTPFPRPHTSFP